MIYATTKPVNEYVSENHSHIGLYTTYEHNPALLALIMVATPLGYHYEGDIPEGLRAGSFRDIAPLERTLDVVVEEKTIAEHLKLLNPLEFNDLIVRMSEEDLTNLPIVKETCEGDSNAFKLIVSARAAAWAINYRGPILASGKLIRVAFGGVPVSEDLIENHRLLEKSFAYSE